MTNTRQARFLYDDYSTHQPVLYEVLLRTQGSVIEFGCGAGSTKLLHHFCEKYDRHLLSIDDDEEWLHKFRGFETPKHEFIYVKDWRVFLSSAGRRAWQYCDLAFVDNEPWAVRHWIIQAIRNTAKFVVLHDCDYFPGNDIFGKNIKQIDGIENKGLRTYDDIFKYYKEFFPLEPWPFPQTGPPTLLASNFEDCSWDINYEKYKNVELFF